MDVSTELTQTLTGERVCDSEPIHQISAIQPHGYMLIFGGDNFRVRSASENIGDLLGSTHSEVLNARLDSILSPTLFALLKKEITGFPEDGNGLQLYTMSEPPYPHVDAYLFRSGDLFGLELQRRQPESEIMLTTDGLLKDYWVETKNLESVEELGHITCRTIRRITGLDRVMIYRFIKPRMHGEVIAEDKVIHSASYYRHRFPTSDIPRPARQLYLRNQTRLIKSANAASVSLVPQIDVDTRKPFDLSDSRLRAVPEVHLQYLRNMQVEGSFSVAIAIADDLWGLICCHHLQPIEMSQPQRSLCEIIGHAFALQATRLESVADARRELEFQGRLRKVFEELRDSREPLEDLFRRHRSLEEIFGITGMALISGDHCDMAGLTLPSKQMIQLAKLIQARMEKENRNVIASQNLSEFGPGWEGYKELACGVLGVRIPMDDSTFLMFRPEVVKTIRWGGDPRKQLEKRDFGGSLNPRASFDSWEETVSGESNEWLPHEKDGAAFLRDFIFDGLVKKEKQIQELYKKATSENR